MGFNKILERNRKYIGFGIAVVIALAIASAVFGRHLLDQSVPIEGDVRSHIFKIEILHSYLAKFAWPQWVPYWYEGFPLDQYYPPGFYFLGAIFTFIFRDSVIAYKVLLLLALTVCGLAVYFFSRKFLKLDARLAIVGLLAYETSTPLWVNFMFGEGPNLTGWGMSLFFLGVYLGNAIDGKTWGLMNLLLPGFLLGVTILIHPFPAIFAILAAAIFFILRLLHTGSYKIRSQFTYLISVLAIGGLIGAYYWVPALLTFKYASPIYAFMEDTWPAGTIYILAIAILAIVVGLIVRTKTMEGLRMDFLISCLILATALGFGATRYLPMGLGSFVQDFRFATIITPFFAVILMIFSLSYSRLTHIQTGKLVTALIGSVFLSALVFFVDNREALRGAFYKVPEIFSNFPQFALIVYPYFTALLLLALSAGEKAIPRNKMVNSLAGGACLVLLASVLPFVNAGKQVNINNRLFAYVNHYQQADYAALMNSVKDSRLVVPMLKGYLIEGDSPVTFGRRWQVETVNGPYNQGDPKFFKHTVHLEWEERWLDYQYTRENLMQEAAAKYIFVRDSFAPPKDTNGLTNTLHNGYGQIWALDQDIYRAAAVTPVLADVQNPERVNEFFNILLPGGYRTVFVNVQDITDDLKSTFNYVLLDDETRIPDYKGKTVFLLKSVNDINNTKIVEEQGVIKLYLPYLLFTSKYFYHGDKADSFGWMGFDYYDSSSRLTADDSSTIKATGNLLNSYLDKLKYTPASYKSSENRIELTSNPGFTLVKDSYFPYWKTDQGRVISTSQGFMLIYSNNPNIVINYERPSADKAATGLTIFGLLAAAFMMSARRFFRWSRHP